jgi:Kef-type K+ transport system membrane component KefB
MSGRHRQLIQNQAKIKVIAQAQDASADKVWFITLVAAAFTGVFYFFSYYWGNEVWRALGGG